MPHFQRHSWNEFLGGKLSDTKKTRVPLAIPGPNGLHLLLPNPVKIQSPGKAQTTGSKLVVDKAPLKKIRVRQLG